PTEGKAPRLRRLKPEGTRHSGLDPESMNTGLRGLDAIRVHGCRIKSGMTTERCRPPNLPPHSPLRRHRRRAANVGRGGEGLSLRAIAVEDRLEHVLRLLDRVLLPCAAG